MSDIQYPLQGACQCGNVTYTLSAPPLMIVACHCRECQKLSTSAFSITAIVKAETITFKGTMSDWSRSADSGNISAAKFCPQCGNRIYHYNPQDKSTLKLKPTNLSDTRIIKPTVHAWISEKQAWFDIPAGVKTFERQPF
jgi:hypothetical protein